MTKLWNWIFLPKNNDLLSFLFIDWHSINKGLNCQMNVGKCQINVEKCQVNVGKRQINVGKCQINVGKCQINVGNVKLM